MGFEMIIEVLGHTIETKEVCHVKSVNGGRSLMVEMAEKCDEKVNPRGYLPKYLHFRFSTIAECEREKRRIVNSFGK